jgi:hypothetical protein
MPVIMPNGDVCDDEDIFGEQIFEYHFDGDDENDELGDEFEDPSFTEMVDRFEFRLAMSAY